VAVAGVEVACDLIFFFLVFPVVAPVVSGDGAEGSTFLVTKNDAMTVVPPGK
jgi:hypothetical protein